MILPITDPARLHLLGKHIDVTDKSAFLSHTSLESVMSFLFLSIRSVFQGNDVTAEKRLESQELGNRGTKMMERWSKASGSSQLLSRNDSLENLPGESWEESFRGSQAWCVFLQMEFQVPPAERTTDTSRGSERRESLSVRADRGDKVSFPTCGCENRGIEMPV